MAEYPSFVIVTGEARSDAELWIDIEPYQGACTSAAMRQGEDILAKKIGPQTTQFYYDI